MPWRSLLLLTLISVLGLARCKNELRERVEAEREAVDERRAATQTAKGATPPTPPPSRTRGCTTEAVQAVTRPHNDAIATCWRKVVQARGPTTTGRFVVEVDISPEGEAKFLGVKEDTVHDPDFTRCVFAVLKPLAYPLPERAACAIVLPFSFTASEARP